MDDGTPSLGVGFEIDPGESFTTIKTLEDMLGSAAANAVREVEKVEKATAGMVNLGPASAAIKTFGSDWDRETRSAAAASARVEKAGESLSKQLERQASTFGLTREEARAMRAEFAANAAEQQGLTELAGRLREQQAGLAAAEAAAAEGARLEAVALRNAAIVHGEFEAAVRRGAAAMREEAAEQQRLQQSADMRNAIASHAQFEARVRAGLQVIQEEEAAIARDAAALQRLREMLDPAAAAQQRLAQEMAETSRVMLVAGHSEEEVAKAHALLARGAGAVANSAGAQRQAVQNLGFQIQDFAVQVVSGGGALRAFAQQFPQAADAMTGFGGKAKGIGDFFAGPWGIALTVAATVAAGFAMQMEETKTKAEKEAEALKTVKGAIEALDEATGRLHKSKQQQIADSQAATQAHLKEALATRTLLQAELDRSRGLSNGGSDGGLDVATTVGASVDRQVTSNAATIKRLQESLAGVGFSAAVDKATASVNKAAAANQAYDATFTRIQAAFARSEKQAKTEEDHARNNTLAQQLLTEAMRKRDAAVQAASGNAGSMIAADARLASASNDVQRAEGARAKVIAENAIALRNHTLTQDQATARLAAADTALDKARDAQKAHNLATQEATRLGKQHAKVLVDLAAAREAEGAAARKQMLEHLDEWNKPIAVGSLVPKTTDIGEDISKIIQASEVRGPLADMNKDLKLQLDLWDDISKRASEVASNMQDAFGQVGGSIGRATEILAAYGDQQKKLNAERDAAGTDQAALDANSKRSADLQLNSMIGLTDAAKGLFKEHSKGYQAMEAAEKALTIVQLARTAIDVAGGAARMFSTLGPFAFPAVAAMLGIMASLGFGGGGAGISSEDFAKGNTGTGTVLGDSSAQSDSIKRAIDTLKEVDTVTSTYAREMAGSLRSIDSQIGSLATVLVRSGNISADSSVTQGFKTNALGSVLGGLPSSIAGTAVGTLLLGPVGAVLGPAIGKVVEKIPIIGDLLDGLGSVIKSLFGTKTTVIGSGITANAQSLSDILSSGFDGQTYSDVQKKKKFFGITTGTSYSTVLGGSIDDQVASQFTLILKSFNDAILAAAGPLGQSTNAIEGSLDNFVFKLGKIDLSGLSGTEIQDKLEAVFGAAADDMAKAAFPFIDHSRRLAKVRSRR
jgi:hypothetical protein